MHALLNSPAVCAGFIPIPSAKRGEKKGCNVNAYCYEMIK